MTEPEIEALARAAAARARAEYYREQRRAERADRRAESVGAGRRGNRVATALADAYLAAGGWRRPVLVRASRDVLGQAPQWTHDVIDQVLDAYHRPPADRPRELARFIARLRTFRLHLPGAPGWGLVPGTGPIPRVPGPGPAGKPVRVRARPVTATVTLRRPYDTPRLDDVAALAEWLGLSISELDWFADPRGMNRRAPDRRLRHYRYLWLNGRLVEAPKPRLRALQRRVHSELLSRVPVHPAVHGFVPGRSPHTFGAVHAGQPVVVRCDVLSFFASVTAARVNGILRLAGLPEPVAYHLTALCTTRTPALVGRTAPAGLPDKAYRLALLRSPHLPQGAPTSPALANLCGFALDRRLAGLARAYGARYSRYADDLAFSGDLHRPDRLVARVTEIVADEGFRLNPTKTRIRGAADRQALAGLVVNAAPAVPRAEYDALRALLHNAVHTGLAEQNRDGHANFESYVAGRIAWVGHRHPARAAKLHALLERVSAGPTRP